MSDSKHTPGPWGVEWQHPCYWIIRDESGSGVHLPPGSAIDDPNRLLIERAPETKRQRDELLSACKASLNAISSLNRAFETGYGPEDVAAYVRSAFDQIHEAINNTTKEEA